MARWNRKLLARLPEPAEVADDGWVCLSYQCEDKAAEGNPVRMVVAAKWLQENSFVCPDNRPDNIGNLSMEFPMLTTKAASKASTAGLIKQPSTCAPHVAWCWRTITGVTWAARTCSRPVQPSAHGSGRETRPLSLPPTHETPGPPKSSCGSPFRIHADPRPALSPRNSMSTPPSITIPNP